MIESAWVDNAIMLALLVMSWPVLVDVFKALRHLSVLWRPIRLVEITFTNKNGHLVSKVIDCNDTTALVEVLLSVSDKRLQD